VIAAPRMGALVCLSVPSELAALLLVPGEGGQITASGGDAPACPSGTSALIRLLLKPEGALISDAVGINGSSCCGASSLANGFWRRSGRDAPACPQGTSALIRLLLKPEEGVLISDVGMNDSSCGPSSLATRGSEESGIERARKTGW
jgi:hypothetical protein